MLFNLLNLSKNMKKAALTFVVLFISISLFSQDVIYSKNYYVKKAKRYEKMQYLGNSLLLIGGLSIGTGYIFDKNNYDNLNQQRNIYEDYHSPVFDGSTFYFIGGYALAGGIIWSTIGYLKNKKYTNLANGITVSAMILPDKKIYFGVKYKF